MTNTTERVREGVVGLPVVWRVADNGDLYLAIDLAELGETAAIEAEQAGAELEPAIRFILDHVGPLAAEVNLAWGDIFPGK
jgi:hypothetical protein